MIDLKKIEALVPRACQWMKAQEELILKYGAPLGPRQLADAERVGVQDPSRIRVLVVDRIPLPEDEELADAARRAQIITDASPCVSAGHGVMIRADKWRHRESLLHALVHVAQCERSGSLDKFVADYLSDRTTCATFSLGLLEEEARQLAREICEEEETVLA